MKLLKYKWFYFGFSLLIILPGLFSMIRWGLRLSIDFTGGSLIELKTNNRANSRSKIEEVLKNEFTKKYGGLKQVYNNADTKFLEKWGSEGKSFHKKVFPRKYKNMSLSNISNLGEKQ